METRCEHCGQDCWVDDERAGESVVCPVCDRVFTANEPVEHLTQLGSLVDMLLAEMPAATTAVVFEPGKPRSDHKPQQRRMRRRALVATVGGLAACACLFSLYRGVVWVTNRVRSQASEVSSADVKDEVSEWRPNAAVQAFLGKPKSIEEFVFNPPEGFDAFNIIREPDWVPREGHFVGLQWEGPLGEKAQMRCWIVKFSEAEPLTGGLKEALDRFFGWLKHHGTILRLSNQPPETGVINGQPCIRAAFTGQYRTKGGTRMLPRDGVVYVLINGDRQVCLYTLCDPAVHDVEVVMDASWMTWRRR